MRSAAARGQDVVYRIGSAACKRYAMVSLQRPKLAAIGAAPAVSRHERQPLRSGEGSTHMETRPASATRRTSDRRTVRARLDHPLELLRVFRIAGASRGVVGVAVIPTPSAHGLASFQRVCTNPLTSVGTPAIRILVRHACCHTGQVTAWQQDPKLRDPARWPGRCCGETIRTSDLRVMSPASYHCSTPRCKSTAYSRDEHAHLVPTKSAIHRAMRGGRDADDVACARASASRCTAMSASHGHTNPRSFDLSTT